MSEGRENLEIITYVIILIVAIVASQHMNVVVSGSMEPVFYRGDIVVIQKSSFLGIEEFDPETLTEGDIVIYDATWFPEPVIHRIVEVGTDRDGKTYYITKGDNNPAPDPVPVHPSQVKARVITIGSQPLIVPKIGYITLWIKGL